MSDDGFELTPDELRRVVSRNHLSLKILTDRVGMLTRENVELLSIIDELQTDLAEARQVLTDLHQSSEVESGHAVVHAVPHDAAAVPSR